MGPLPLARWRVLRTSNVDVARTRVAALFNDHQLAPETGIQLEVNHCRLRHTAVTAMRYRNPVSIHPGHPRPFYTLLAPIAGTALLRIGDTDVRATTHTAVLVSTTEPLSMRWSHDCAMLAVRIERGALDARLAESLRARVRRPPEFAPLFERNHGLHATLRALVSALDDPRAATIDRSTLWDGIEDALLRTLIYAQPHSYTDELHHAPPATVTTHELNHAIALIESHPEIPHTIGHIAGLCNVSPRSLQRAFQQRLGTTFRGYLHDIRLGRIHDDLRAYPADTATVASVAERWGATYSAHLVRAYRARFDETPADTVERPSPDRPITGA